MNRPVLGVRIAAGETVRTYSLRHVPRWLHWLAIDLLTWRVAIAHVRGRYRSERAALRADWERR